MVAALVTALLLHEAPIDVPRRSGRKLTFSISIGSFIGSVWASAAFREKVYAFRDEAMDDLHSHNSVLDSQYLIYGVPVLGPWYTIAMGGQQAREDVWLLVLSGSLQAFGLSALTYRMLTQRVKPMEPAHEEGLDISFSPYVSGRLGIGVSLSGF